VCRFVRQDQVQALQELLEIDLEVGPRLDLLHRADSSMENRDFGARLGSVPVTNASISATPRRENAAAAADTAPPASEAP
jgi:hypothetical protein